MLFRHHTHYTTEAMEVEVERLCGCVVEVYTRPLLCSHIGATLYVFYEHAVPSFMNPDNLRVFLFVLRSFIRVTE